MLTWKITLERRYRPIPARADKSFLFLQLACFCPKKFP